MNGYMTYIRLNVSMNEAMFVTRLDRQYHLCGANKA